MKDIKQLEGATGVPTKEEYVSQNEYLQRFMYQLLDTSDTKRAFGRSTLMANAYIELMLDNLNEWFVIRDHHPRGDKDLMNLICKQLETTEVKVFRSTVSPMFEVNNARTQIRIIGFNKVNIPKTENNDTRN